MVASRDLMLTNSTLIAATEVGDVDMSESERYAIEIDELEYSYDSKKVLDKLSLKVEPGTILGILGKNGCGKTTLMNCLLGFLKPQAGVSTIFGEPSRQLSADVRQRLAFVPQVNDLFRWMKGQEVIDYVSRFYRHWNPDLIRTLVNEWEVPLDSKIKTMSVGEKQKLAVALAMGHEPDLLILDEPVASLDPAARRNFIKYLIELNSEKGNTIIFSTHITFDIERAAGHVAILHHGKTFFQGEIDALKERVVRLHLHSSRELPQRLEIKDCISSKVAGNEAIIVVDHFDSEKLRIIKQIYDAEVSFQSMNLEDIFVSLTSTSKEK